MRTAKDTRLDRIKVSVISNRLDAISKEIGQTMLRTSRSPIFSEARDFVTAVFDAKIFDFNDVFHSVTHGTQSGASIFAGRCETTTF